MITTTNENLKHISKSNTSTNGNLGNRIVLSKVVCNQPPLRLYLNKLYECFYIK